MVFGRGGEHRPLHCQILTKIAYACQRMANNDRGGVRANTVSKKQKKTSMKTKGIASELAGTSFHLQLCAENVRHERERE